MKTIKVFQSNGATSQNSGSFLYKLTAHVSIENS